ncbi:MAG TPA: glycerophosphodiester phosphodiesterase family protein [bacterium]
MRKILNIAHRGASGIAPENTGIAFEKAIECGADIIECDIHQTSDGDLVVIHNENIKSYTGIEACVKNLTLNYLKELDFGKWFSEKYSGQKIMTLKETLNRFGSRINFNLEIKNGERYYKGISELIIKTVHEAGLSTNVIISSFDLPTLKRVKEIDKNMSIGIIFDKNEWDDILKSAAELGCIFLVPKARLVSSENIKLSHSQNLKVYPYVINSEEEGLHLIKMGTDGIITDRPEMLSSVLKNISQV